MKATTLTIIACVLMTVSGPISASQEREVSDEPLRAFIEQTDREWPGESYQQGITVESLTLLAGAVTSLAQGKGAQVRLADDVARLRMNIRGYKAGLPDDDRQSARLHRTLVHASGLIHRLVAEANHERRPSDPELNALNRAAESLDEDRSLRRQPDVIERFFAHAAAILRRLDHQQVRPPEVEDGRHRHR